jgi:hypothetical protein
MDEIELLTIDPGVHKSAVALWNSDDRLVFADDLKNDAVFRLIRGVAEAARVVVETPIKYPTKRKQHKDVGNLLEVAEQMKKTASRSLGVSPSAWKGQVPKKIHGRRILEALEDTEKKAALTIDNHNTIDAIGLGLWVLGRLGRGGT